MRNEGTLDRVVRVVVGVALVSLLFVGPRSTWGLLGLLPLLTGLSGFCPLYLPFGVDTRARPPSPRPPAAGADARGGRFPRSRVSG